jgi:nitroreductase
MAGYRSFSVLNRAPSELQIPDDLPSHPMLSSITAVPEVLVVTADLRELAVLDRDLARPSIVGGGSIYPFIQNLLLAARNEGLGAGLTTFLAAEEPQAARLLRLPQEHAIAALIGVGFPLRPFPRLKRKSVEEFATTDCFDGMAFQTNVAEGGSETFDGFS